MSQETIIYKVEVRGARALVPLDPNGQSDPYCKIGLADDQTNGFIDPSNVLRSKTHFVTLNPVWKGFSMIATSIEYKIRVEIWDKDQDVEDNFEGFAILDLNTIQEDFTDKWLPLRGRTADERVTGDVNVVIRRGLMSELNVLSRSQSLTQSQGIEKSISGEVTSFTSKVAKYLHLKGNQCEASGNLKLAQAYYQAALNETNSYDEVHHQANTALANLRKLKEVAKDQKSEQRIQQIEKQIEEMEKTMRTRNTEEMKEIEQQRNALERERASLAERMKEVAERERKNAEFEEKYHNWEKKLQPPEGKDMQGSKEAAQLLVSVREANEEVDKDRRDYTESAARAEDAKLRLDKSEKDFREKEERLNNYIVIVEQQNEFRELLKATRHLTSSLFPNKIKCFISYAWQPEGKENAVLQARLVQIKEDLEESGIEVLLDIHNMEGDINKYMMEGIQKSDRVLLICTPRFRQRAEEKAQIQNNLQKELNAALQRQNHDPKFIIPLILEGDRATSIAQDLPDILSLDFTDQKKYFENMVSLSPKGLIPMILGLERHKVYAHLLKGYNAHLKLLLLSMEKK